MSDRVNHWLIDSPLSLCLVVIVQIAVVSVIAWLVAARIKRVDAGRTYAVWLTAACLTLGILPAHLLLGGWKIPLASAEVDVARQSIGTDQRARRNDGRAMQPMAVIPSPLEREEDSTLADLTTQPNRLSTALPATSSSAFTSAGEDVLLGRTSDLRSSATIDRKLDGSTTLTVFVWIYVAGFVWVALRFSAGMIRLRVAAAKGQRVDPQFVALANDIAERIGLTRVPLIVRTDRTSMPLVFGLFRFTVLVPRQFESWSDDEIRSTLFHELMHVRRHDGAVQLIASMNLMLYWFHPAVWLIDRRLSESREWATDRDVLIATSENYSGLSSGRYAESLLNIVSRFRSEGTTTQLSNRSAIAMSRHTQIEDRLTLILNGVPGLSRWRIASLRLMVALLAVAAIATTVRLEHSIAQGTPDQQTQSGSADTGQAEADNAGPVYEPIRPDDNDLIARVLGSKPTLAEPDDYAVIVNVSGTVLSPDGQPVSGAAVVLRESSGHRVSRDPQKYLYSVDRDLIRAPDVIGRTDTNASGEFEFAAVKAPAFPNDRTDRWVGSLVAAMPGAGVATLQLIIEKSNPKPVEAITLQLAKTNSISGRFVTPDGQPLGGAIVNLTGLYAPTADPWDAPERFELLMSQLTPKTITDNSGYFEFENIPVGLIASIEASHDDWEDGYAAIRTSDDVAIGKFERPNPRLPSGEVVESPATVVADPGYTLVGNVSDERGAGIAGVSVYPSSSVDRDETDSDGNFRFRVATHLIKYYFDRDDRPMKFSVVTPEESPFLLKQIELSKEQVTGKEPINVVLPRAVAISGKMVDASGTPVKGISIRSLDGPAPYGAVSKENGTFSLKLPLGEHLLVMTTREPGYAIPSSSYGMTKEEAASLPHRKITITDFVPRELEPIVVPKLATYQVIVSLPDGKPAVGASVILRDEATASTNAPEFDRAPRIVDKSEAETTNSLGRATLVPQGVTSPKAFIDVKYLRDDAAFDGTVKLSEAKDGVVHLVLQSSAIVEGRVLLDGKPVAGARMQVSLTKPIQRTANGMTMTVIQSKGHQFVTTDSEGVYRASVPAGERVSVSLNRVPSLSVGAGIGYNAQPASDGKLIVKDFELIRGDQEIAGRVIDADGNPVAKAMVSIRRDRNVIPNFWVDHDRESQSTTDANGRFHLKKVPQGNYQLMVRGPRGASSVSSSRISTMVPVSTGEMNLDISLNLPSAPPIQRLIPVEITPRR
ncbi:carboxypeptidase regulatory-like domain-containing protein [Planctomycetes bacterium TBK1r]|uniref:Regulatory protein BlaR1 n=1 Tax=Stieleria magnilauensis TaxID=2527963 RepID=A0ABX5XTF7_9BACT|nr:Regulatory protein BlaR1 [Planctomycetes bacterium TBK1r]